MRCSLAALPSCARILEERFDIRFNSFFSVILIFAEDFAPFPIFVGAPNFRC